MIDLAGLDQNITYEKNLLQEKEIAFELHKETDIKDIEDLELQIESLKNEFTQNLQTKKKVNLILFISKIKYMMNF